MAETLTSQFLLLFANPLEVMAVVLGILSVYFVIKRSVWSFPIGIVMVSVYAFIFYAAKLYSDMLLQLFFVVMQALGWHQWLAGPRAQDAKIEVRVLRLRQILLSFLCIGLITFLLGLSMDKWTDTDVPYADACTTAISVVAQWWLNQRYYQNWHYWIVVDVLYIFLYAYKSLYLTSLLYVIFLIMAILGLLTWKKQIKEELLPEAS